MMSNKKQEEIDKKISYLKKVLPSNSHKKINPEFVELLDNISGNQEYREQFRDNFIGYSFVLQEGRYKLTSYLNAVKYITYKLMGDSNYDAWVKTFPDRYANHKAKGTKEEDIHSYVAGYNRSKLVVALYAQAIVPSYVANADIYQRAVNTQAQIMVDPNVSAKVRSDAADSLMRHLKQPESIKMEHNIQLKQDDSLSELTSATAELVQAQKEALQKGVMNLTQIAESKIIKEVKSGEED